jgi:hypothetical protein
MPLSISFGTSRRLRLVLPPNGFLLIVRRPLHYRPGISVSFEMESSLSPKTWQWWTVRTFYSREIDKEPEAAEVAKRAQCVASLEATGLNPGVQVDEALALKFKLLGNPI